MVEFWRDPTNSLKFKTEFSVLNLVDSFLI